jgi:hypothetical protein
LPTKDEIQKVIEWCDEQKKEKGLVSFVMRNELREKVPWTYRFPLIEVDRPLDAANKTSLVYDSTTKTLFQHYMGEWRKVEPEVEIKIN